MHCAPSHSIIENEKTWNATKLFKDREYIFIEWNTVQDLKYICLETI